MEATVRQELLGKCNMRPPSLSHQSQRWLQAQQRRNLCGLNKTECEHAKEQAGFASPVSMGALHWGQHPEKQPKGVQRKL